MARSLLVEIGTEELPSGFIPPALDFLERRLTERFREIKLAFERIEVFGTPRRLALRVSGLADKLEDVVETRMGPPKNIAYDAAGSPTKAALGFAKTCGVDINEITFEETPKGAYLCVTRSIPGKKTSEVLVPLLKDLIAQIPFAKTMKWSNPGVRFARPVHWIVCLFGDEVLPLSFGNICAGRTTRGNRFMARTPLEIASPEAYDALLEEGFVIADINRRKSMILEGLRRHASELDASCEDEELLDEVVNLLEYPHVIRGTFDQDFLKLPPEVLVTVMKHHQRFFPLYDTDGKLKPYFLAVSNIVPKDESLVRRGNERVLRARLDDARYFFTEDLKVPLKNYAERLRDVIFHKDLGTSFEKVERFTHSALYLADYLAPDRKDKVRQAAFLCKADLNSLMVCELPELQGIMGREYARHQGIDDEVAQAIHEHYLPRFAEDELPTGVIGDLVGIADRIDTICGCFGIGMIPSGTSDPYALRRQTIAIENILLGKGYRISITDLIDQALSALADKITRPGTEVREDVLAYFRARFVSILQARDIPGDVIEAVLPGFDDPVDTFIRAKALAAVKHEPWLSSIGSAAKRVENILKKVEASLEVSETLLTEGPEIKLHERLIEVEIPFVRAAGKGEYSAALRLLVGLKDPIDTFFDEVLVMSEDEGVRENRIALLKRLLTLFNRVARFSALST